LANEFSASGILISCTDPQTKHHYFLFGQNNDHHLCHFHGCFEPTEANKNLDDLTYNQVAHETASKKYREQSLEVICSEDTIRTILENKDDLYKNYFCQIFPDQHVNVRCYWFHMGHVGPLNRKSICQRFVSLNKDPDLNEHQKEMKKLIWVDQTELLKAIGDAKLPSNRIKVTVDNHSFHLRKWLTSWFLNILNKNESSEGSTKFREFCTSGKEVPLKSLLDL